MKLYFVRHGQTESNAKRLMYGNWDSPLTPEGVEAAMTTANEISQDFDLIYSSDLGRAKHTAEILNKKLNLPINYDARLRERHFGSLEGTDMLSTNKEMWQKDHVQEYNYRPWGGESMENVKERIMDFVSDMKKNSRDKKVLVVTHGGIMRLIYFLLNGKPAEKIHNASVHEFDFPDE